MDLESGARVPITNSAALSANVSLLWYSTWTPNPEPRDWVQGGHPETSHNFPSSCLGQEHILLAFLEPQYKQGRSKLSDSQDFDD
jgi:hypothetical protein